MIKVIKHGHNKTTKICYCSCGCEFEYEVSDLQYDVCTIVNCTAFQKTYYLICPDCGEKILAYPNID